MSSSADPTSPPGRCRHAGIAAVAAARGGRRVADGTLALADLDLPVVPGEFISVVGPTG